ESSPHRYRDDLIDGDRSEGAHHTLETPDDEIGRISRQPVREIAHAGDDDNVVLTPLDPHLVVPRERQTDRVEAGAEVRDRCRDAFRISRSVTARIAPSESRAASSACFHEAGLPMRIAVAIVDGFSIGCPLTIGAAPAAWKPNMRGRNVMLFASRSSR